MHPEAATGSGSGLDPAAERGGALGHTRQPEPAAGSGSRTRPEPVVRHLEVQAGRVQPEPDRGARGRTGMAEYVGERLLQDAVRRMVYRIRQRPIGIEPAVELDLQAGGADRGEQSR